jgi:hypothetical protein
MTDGLNWNRVVLIAVPDEPTRVHRLFLSPPFAESFGASAIVVATGLRMAETGQTGPALADAHRKSLSGHVSRSGAQA